MIFSQSKGLHDPTKQGDKFSISSQGTFAQKISVELIKGSSSAFLWSFVTKMFPDVIPLDRFGEGVCSGSDYPCESRGEFRSEGYLSIAFVLEVK